MLASIQSFVRGPDSSRFSSNSEAKASKLIENLEEMFLRYYMDSDIISRFKSSTMPYCVTRFERVNIAN